MTEAEWLSARLHHEPLQATRSRHTGRKLLLLGCACCRLGVSHGRDPKRLISSTVDFLEGCADTGIVPAGWQACLKGVRELDRPGGARRGLIEAMSDLFGLALYGLAERPQIDMAWTKTSLVMNQAPRKMHVHHDSAEQCKFIRDIFGNPFRPVAFDPRWRSADAVGLARGIYEERAFDRLPLLADALMDAGCDDEQVLGHCRGGGPHVRGCWVVDLVLGKE